jgi:glycine/D-amino acid oxidase-like deaminating enzyme
MISIWEKETFFAPHDIVIAGGGFVGLWCAFYLKKKKPNLKISIVDRGIIPTGASTRNAGFACFGSLSELIRDASEMGTEKMLELVEMRFRGLKRIQKYFSEDEIDFDLCGGYELYDAADAKTEEQLEENISYLNSLLKPITGTKQTFKLADEKLSHFGFGNTKHLIRNNAEGYLHSGKMILALLQRVQAMGVHVFTGTEIKSFEDISSGIEIQTNHNFSLSTKQLLICTNAFAKELLPGLDIIPARGQVLLTSPIRNLPWRGTFHSDEGYYYFRNLGNRVLLGGARNKAFDEEQTTQMETSKLIQVELERYLSDVVLPGYRDRYAIEQRWSGIMAMGSEKMPIIKEIQPNVFCAVRMSGMGVALAPVAGQVVAKMML